MKVKNILWLIPDGVRTVKYNDPFGRFEFFKTLKNEGFCEFKICILLILVHICLFLLF